MSLKPVPERKKLTVCAFFKHTGVASLKPKNLPFKSSSRRNTAKPVPMILGLLHSLSIPVTFFSVFFLRPSHFVFSIMPGLPRTIEARSSLRPTKPRGFQMEKAGNAGG